MTTELDRVLETVSSLARERGYTCRLVRPDRVLLSGPTVFTLPLNEIRRRVRTHPVAAWPGVVADCIDAVAVTFETDRDDPLDYSDFGVMRHLIRTRLYGTASVGSDGVRRVVAPGLIQRVLIDRVHMVVPVTYAMLARWPIGEWELFQLAEDNVRGDGGVHIDTLHIGSVHTGTLDIGGLHPPTGPEDIGPIARLRGPEYLTAHARWLGDHPVTGPEGAVLTMPSKESIYACPVVGPGLADSVDALAVLATVHADDPWPVNSNVYWWRDGSLDLAATTFRRDTTIHIGYTDTYVRHSTRLGLGAPPRTDTRRERP
ncbi:hypothetical protein [Nocardia africana]